MTLLHELLAVEPDVVNVTTSVLDEALITFSKKTDHFIGQARAVKHLEETRSNEDVNDSKAIVTTVDDKLDYVLKNTARLYDVLLQKDATNCIAKADLEVEGITLAKNVPGIFLLGMETRLKKLRDVLHAIPTLEPAIDWQEDPNKGKGVYRAPVATTMRTEKVLEHKILVQATDKHPAQVEKWTADKNVARIDTTRFSAMWSTARKSEVLGRLDKLMAAIKQARMRANLAEVPKINIGEGITKYLLTGK